MCSVAFHVRSHALHLWLGRPFFYCSTCAVMYAERLWGARRSKNLPAPEGYPAGLWHKSISRLNGDDLHKVLNFYQTKYPGEYTSAVRCIY